MVRTIGGFLRARTLLLSGLAALAIGAHVASFRSAGTTSEQLARMLSAASGSLVEPDGIRWESGATLFENWFPGRRLLFVGRPHEGAPRDVYRARVAVSPEGGVLRVRSVRNLTQTPVGDERGLQVKGGLAAYATVAFDELQGITVLSTNGARSEDRVGPFFNRLLLRLRGWQRVASFSGLSPVHLKAANETAVSFRLNEQGLEIFQGTQRSVYDAKKRKMIGVDETFLPSVQRLGSENWLHTVVELVRTEFGPGFISVLEGWVFGSEALGESTTDDQRLSAPMASAKLEETVAWPPVRLTPMRSEPETSAREGMWEPVPEQPEFQKTILYPLEDAAVHLLAIDMRRLELRMEAGYEEPRPTTGPPGRGALPSDPQIRERVVATFNGAFRSVHGGFGMMVDGRVLIPPVSGAATVAVAADGRAGLGVWPASDRVPTNLSAFRQNLEPLIHRGALNPSGRRSWGDHVIGHGALTERSALCQLQSGQLLYAWGKSIGARGLSKALHHAGCVEAIHLDMNPGHCGFAFTDVRGPKPADVSASLAFRGMAMNPKRYALWSDKDFFYLLRRGVGRKPTLAGLPWLPSPGLQPGFKSQEGADVPPSIFSSHMTLGAVTLDLLFATPETLYFNVVAGSDEPVYQGRRAPPRALPKEQAERAVVSLSVGHTTKSTGYGLAFGNPAMLTLRKAYATFLIEGGQLRLFPSGTARVAMQNQVAVQVPELLKAGEITDRARQRGGYRTRGGLCILPSGAIVVATARHDSSDVVALALFKLGCSHGVELDRGSKHDAVVGRAGTDVEVFGDGVATRLFGVAKGTTPTTFRFPEEL